MHGWMAYTNWVSDEATLKGISSRLEHDPIRLQSPFGDVATVFLYFPNSS